MALGLYDSAFATLTGLYGRAARGPITGITLIAGFASTVGWPLSAFLDASVGWRGPCLIWAALHLLVGLPLNRLLIPRAPPPTRTAETQAGATVAPRGAMPILAFVFAATWFVTGAMAAPASAPRIAGASSTAAIHGRLVGPHGGGAAR
jgi:predicted MFS family arabinose efflux permease